VLVCCWLKVPKRRQCDATPALQFFMAEDYHHENFRLNGHPPHCQLVVSPKVSKFRKLFAAKRKAS
jgi:peptide-methionine (S)-S-oxide reductase